jgi:hypothetical protein
VSLLMTRSSECLVTELTCKGFGTCMHPGAKHKDTLLNYSDKYTLEECTVM